MTPLIPVERPPRRSFSERFNDALQRLLVWLKVEDVPHIKRIIVTVVGGTVVILGAVMVLLPGPGLLSMLAGLAILGTEYAWARRWLRNARKMAKKALSQTQIILSPLPAEPPVGQAKTARDGATGSGKTPG